MNTLLSTFAGLLFTFLLVSGGAAGPATESGRTTDLSEEVQIEWLDTLDYDFGDLLYQEPRTHTFRFRNLGDEPILIDNVRTACGCTTTEWRDTPVEPDSIGRISVEYDARSKGYFRKYIKVYFNDRRGADRLWISGFVE
ncbi:MAG: DUF1573 domain-containing protein [Saprospiraceae bacterium]